MNVLVRDLDWLSRLESDNRDVIDPRRVTGTGPAKALEDEADRVGTDDAAAVDPISFNLAVRAGVDADAREDVLD